MYLGFQRVAVSNVVLLGSALTVPAGASGAELQSETNAVRYTMDGTEPTTASGMLLRTADPPKGFLIEDILRMRYVRDGAVNSVLNVHFFGGRSI